MRVISDTGEQLGIMNIFDAIDLAKSKNLDLIQVTEKVEPPVCRIGNYGKYIYSLQKKERKTKTKTKSELKEIQLSFGISQHDIEIKANRAKEFLENGDKVKVNLVLRGREKAMAMAEFAKAKIIVFIETLDKLIPIKTERELKKEPRGFTMIISKK